MQDQIVLLGTGTARSSSTRHAPGVLLFLHAKPYLIDSGPGIQRRLALIEDFSISDLNHIFLTHHHADHVSDLIIILKEYLMLNRTDPLFIYGPVGISNFIKILFTQAFSYLSPVLDFTQVQDCERGLILEEDSVQVSAAPTVHSVPSIGFRFDTSKGSIDTPKSSIVLSGDTARAPPLIELAKKAKFLIHECSFPDGIETNNHVTAEILGKIAQEADVENLVLTHFYPVCESKMGEIRESILQNFSGNVVIGEDLLRIPI